MLLVIIAVAVACTVVGFTFGRMNRLPGKDHKELKLLRAEHTDVRSDATRNSVLGDPFSQIILDRLDKTDRALNQ